MPTQQNRPTLRKGDRVAVVSPASAARADLIAQGVQALRAYGYEPVVMPHALSRGPLYYAGTAEQRASDLQQAFADTSVRAILCTRGGWGSAELLPLLDPVSIRENPKVLVGYSDQTSLQTWLWQNCGLPTWYGPMVAADWSHQGGADLASWSAAMAGETYTLGALDGLRTLRPGLAHGRLLGGCLALVEAGLGTPYSMRIEEPCLLFLEDINVKPYQWDRMLQHLQFAGLLRSVKGIILGDMSASVEQAEVPLLEAACLHALRNFDGPIAIGLRCGHVTGGNRTLVLGAEAALHCDDQVTLTVRGSTLNEVQMVRRSAPHRSAVVVPFPSTASKTGATD